jgi:hypothetical protein
MKTTSVTSVLDVIFYFIPGALLNTVGIYLYPSFLKEQIWGRIDGSLVFVFASYLVGFLLTTISWPILRV